MSNYFISESRAWMRKFMRNLKNIDAASNGVRVQLTIRYSDEPRETRIGSCLNSNESFYEHNSRRIWGYYYGYKNSYEHRNDMLYAETISFCPDALDPVLAKSVQPRDVKIILGAVPYRIPPKLKSHATAAVDIFKQLGKLNIDTVTGEWENNTSLRLMSYEKNGIFRCQSVRYFDQVATNLTLDWGSGYLPDGGFTLRSSLEMPIEGKLSSFDSSHLANNFGTAVMFYDMTLSRTFIRLRSDALASITERALHSTVSGVLQIPPNLAPGEYGFELFLNGTHLEIKTETGLDPHQYILYPVAFSRELPRGGKPQLFFVAISLVSDETFEERCQIANEKNEYIIDNDGLFFNEKTKVRFPELFTYEGWACHLLAEDFVTANEANIKNIISEKINGI